MVKLLFSPDEQKILPSELKIIELKIGQVTFSTDEQNISPSELFEYNNKFSKLLFSLDGTKFLPSELIKNIIFKRHKSTKMT